VPIYGVTFSPVPPGPAILNYYLCKGADDGGQSTADIGNTLVHLNGQDDPNKVSELDRSALMLNPPDPRVLTFGLASPYGIPDPILSLAGQGLCAQSTDDLNLMTGNPNLTRPSLPYAQIDNHPVPSFGNNPPPGPP